MRGETVSVIPREPSGMDAFGMAAWADGEPVEVNGVLVAPSDVSDVADETRDGDAVTYTLCWPKDYDGPALDGLDIVVRGERARVIGAPRAFDAGACPTRWNMVVKAVVAHG